MTLGSSHKTLFQSYHDEVQSNCFFKLLIRQNIKIFSHFRIMLRECPKKKSEWNKFNDEIVDPKLSKVQRRQKLQKNKYDEQCQQENKNDEILVCDKDYETIESIVGEETNSQQDYSVPWIIDPKLPKIQRRKELMRYRYSLKKADQKDKQYRKGYSGCDNMIDLAGPSCETNQKNISDKRSAAVKEMRIKTKEDVAVKASLKSHKRMQKRSEEALEKAYRKFYMLLAWKNSLTCLQL